MVDLLDDVGAVTVGAGYLVRPTLRDEPLFGCLIIGEFLH
jgi:hypothetical protein